MTYPGGTMISNYTVDGMTCDHCVRAVTEEVNAVPGVAQAEVDLSSRSMTVTSTEPVDFTLIKSAVAEAGDYTVTAA
jgi:copper chaperone CopZ